MQLATLRYEGDELVVRLNDLEKAGALRRTVRVPARTVRAIRVSQTPFRELRGIRLVGASIPGVIALGLWRGRAGKDFAAVYRGGPAVVAELEGAPWQRLIVSDHDAARLAESLRADLGL